MICGLVLIGPQCKIRMGSSAYICAHMEFNMYSEFLALFNLYEMKRCMTNVCKLLYCKVFRRGGDRGFGFRA